MQAITGRDFPVPYDHDLWRQHGSGKPLNMSTGPVEVSRRVMEAQLADSLISNRPSFWDAHDETVSLLQTILRTRGRVFMAHGSIRSGIDQALSNAVRPGSKVLCLQNGFWGELIGDWAEMRGAKVSRLSLDPLAPVDPQAVEMALAEDSYDLVTMAHVETNSGILNPVEAIGRIVAPTDALFMVDTACSAGAIEVQTDQWSIDIGVTGSHKCLAALPGLSVTTYSEKANDRITSLSPQNVYFNPAVWWRSTMERSEEVPFTQPVTLVLALREALLEIDSIGIENWWRIHKSVADSVLRFFADAGIGHLLDDGPVSGQRAFYSDTVMAMKLPDSLPGQEDFRDALMDRFGIFVGGNIGAFNGSSFRLGLMSTAQLDPVNLSGTLSAISAVATGLAPVESKD